MKIINYCERVGCERLIDSRWLPLLNIRTVRSHIVSQDKKGCDYINKMYEGD